MDSSDTHYTDHQPLCQGFKTNSDTHTLTTNHCVKGLNVRQ